MSKMVAVIDDEENICDLLKDLLVEKYDFNVVGFSKLDSFLEVSNLASFDLILSDVHMPSGSGLRLLRELEAINQIIPVIFISGFADVLSPKKGTVILRKPINNDELFKHIDSILEC